MLAYSSSLWNLAAPPLANLSCASAAVIYVDDHNPEGLLSAAVPSLRHVAGAGANPPTPSRSSSPSKEYRYPNVTGQQRWFCPGHGDFDYSADSVAHTRSLQFLKPKMDGPFFDLEGIWEEHTYYEFADRSVEHTMSTMVQEPYVNHVPTVRQTISLVEKERRGEYALTLCTVDGWNWKTKAYRFLPTQLHLQQLGRHEPRACQPDHWYRSRD